MLGTSTDLRILFTCSRFAKRLIIGVALIGGALLLSGCLSNLPDLLLTPTPTPTQGPNLIIDPDVELEPIGGYAGTYVNVIGEGWLPGKLVILKLEDEEGQSGILTANIADSQGRFQSAFVYPSAERWNRPGFYSVIAYALNEDLDASTQFVVIVPTNQPTATATFTPTPSRSPTATPTTTPTTTPIPLPTLTPSQATVGPTITPFEFSFLSTATATPTALAAGTSTNTPTSFETTQPNEANGTTTATPEAVTSAVTAVVTNVSDVPTSVGITITVPMIAVPGAEADLEVPTAVSSAGLTPQPAPTAATATLSPPTPTPTWTPTPEVVIIQEWRADYWTNPELAGAPAVIRNEFAIDHEWGSGSPSPVIPNDNFSARWTRALNFDAGVYTFFVEVDDGARLYVDGQLLINSWQDGGRRTLTAQVVLSQGQHQIALEYYERSGIALIHLTWEGRAVFTGWKAEYFANQGLDGRPVLLRDDERIDFRWGTGSPGPAVPDDQFSARWQRRIFFEEGTYRFTATADDGVRIWVDDRLILEEWRDQSPTTFTSDVLLVEGRHDIRVEYYENTAGAMIEVDWRKIVRPTLVPTPTWTPQSPRPVEVTPTWTPVLLQPTSTWTPNP